MQCYLLYQTQGLRLTAFVFYPFSWPLFFLLFFPHILRLCATLWVMTDLFTCFYIRVPAWLMPLIRFLLFLRYLAALSFATFGLYPSKF